MNLACLRLVSVLASLPTVMTFLWKHSHSMVSSSNSDFPKLKTLKVADNSPQCLWATCTIVNGTCPTRSENDNEILASGKHRATMLQMISLLMIVQFQCSQTTERSRANWGLYLRTISNILASNSTERMPIGPKEDSSWGDGMPVSAIGEVDAISIVMIDRMQVGMRVNISDGGA